MARRIWEEAEQRRQNDELGVYSQPSIGEAYNRGRAHSSRILGKMVGNVGAIMDEHMRRRNQLEGILYQNLHANPDFEISYDSIAAFLDANPQVVNVIGQAFAANLSAQGKPPTEIQKALGDLTQPWYVNYVYSFLTTSSPDYTTSPSVSKENVEYDIESERHTVIGGKRHRKHRKSRKSKKSRKSRKSRKYRRSRK
jgi:hypothetical protein